MQQETKERFTQTADRFLAALEAVPADKFNDKPFDKSWSAAQVAQHIYLSVRGIPQMFDMPVEEEKRDPAKHIAHLRETFTNYNTKFEAPAFIQPEDKQYVKEELMSALRQSFDAIASSIDAHDLNDVPAGVSFPGAGTLSRYEWIWFTVFHTDRHARQAEEIGKLV